MLLCLDRDDRLAYILGEVFEIDSVQAATIVRISPAAFRKRLERSRRRVVEFMEGHCGIVNPDRRVDAGGVSMLRCAPAE